MTDLFSFGNEDYYDNEDFLANVHTLRCMRFASLIYFVAWILDVIGIFIVDLSIMNAGMVGTAAVLAGSFLFAKFYGTDKPLSKYVFLLGLVAMSTFICSQLSYHATLFTLFPMICSSQYHSKKITMYTYVLSCIGCAISVFVGYKVGICDANMTLLTYTTTANHVAQWKMGNIDFNNSALLLFLYFIFPRCVILASVIPLQNQVTKNIGIKAAREVEMRRMAEIDAITGLYNRNKFDNMVESYYPDCDKVAVLFCDVNNLKLTNDTKGHEYGDKLIAGFGAILNEYQSLKCKSYRIGGDEFVLISERDSSDRIEIVMESIRYKVDNKHIEGVSDLSVAMGFAKGPGADIERIIKEADTNMYADKVRIKQQSL